MRKTPLINDHIYHVFNRGVEKRDIYLDNQDYLRFIHNLYEFNDKSSVINARYYFNPKTKQVRSTPLNQSRQPAKDLVDVMVFTLMPNHFHLLIRQKKQGGITKFMQKVCTGYTMYFNNKYKRIGGLLQGRFKSMLVSGEEHFIYLPYYIHTNPLGLINNHANAADWRASMQYLMDYRWSSFPDYIGIKNFPSVTYREFILSVFGGENQYKAHTEDCLKAADQNLWLQTIHDTVID